MSHYEERLERDLKEIRQRLDDIGSRAQRAVRDSVQAFSAYDRRLANLTVLRDRAINHGIRHIDRLCHEFVVRHVPSAGHLRWVSSVLRMNVALERVGDYAVAIARETVQLSKPPSRSLVGDVEQLGVAADRILSQSLAAFRQGDEALARATIDAAREVDETFKVGFHDLVSAAERQERAPRDLFLLLTVLRMLKRVADQGANICQLTLFVVAGVVKEKKFFRILFVEERNDCLSLLAQAYGGKAFADSASFASAGWDPAPEVPAAVLDYLDRHGYDTDGLRPRPVAPRDEDGRHYHIIIGLGADPDRRLATVPYLTATLEWDVGPAPRLDAPDAAEQLERAHRRIAEEMAALMELLVGPYDD